MLLILKYSIIVYLTIGCQTTCGESVLYINIFITTLYNSKSNVHILALYLLVHYHATDKSNTLPLNNRETPIKVLLSLVSFSYIPS